MKQPTLTSSIILKIGEDTFSNIPQEIRESFEVLKVEPNDKELFENDAEYSKLMKEYRRASKDLRDYKFNKRNNGTNNRED